MVFVGKCSDLEFVDDRLTSDQQIRVTTIVPPGPYPVPSGDHFRLCAHFVVEAWDRGLDVYPLAHTLFDHRLPTDDMNKPRHNDFRWR